MKFANSEGYFLGLAQVNLKLDMFMFFKANNLWFWAVILLYLFNFVLQLSERMTFCVHVLLDLGTETQDQKFVYMLQISSFAE